MQKQKLVNFINKYSLGGLCSSVKISNKDGKLLTSFSTEEKDVLGFVMFADVKLAEDDTTFGIFNTATLQKVLGVMQNEINTSFTEEEGKVKALNITDDVFESIIQLADLNIIEEVPTLQDIPSADVKIEINSVTIDQFNKAKGALSESTRMAFVQDGSDIKLVVNYSDYASDTITLDLTGELLGDDIDVMPFNAEKFKEIVSANKDCTVGTIELTRAGLMTVTFKGEGFQSRYYQVMLQE